VAHNKLAHSRQAELILSFPDIDIGLSPNKAARPLEGCFVKV